MEEKRDFASALDALKNGYKVQRESWKDKVDTSTGRITNVYLLVLRGLDKFELMQYDKSDPNLAYTRSTIQLKDILAEDWTVIG